MFICVVVYDVGCFYVYNIEIIICLVVYNIK